MIKLNKSIKKSNNYTLIQLYYGEGCGYQGLNCGNTGSGCTGNNCTGNHC